MWHPQSRMILLTFRSLLCRLRSRRTPLLHPLPVQRGGGPREPAGLGWAERSKPAQAGFMAAGPPGGVSTARPTPPFSVGEAERL